MLAVVDLLVHHSDVFPTLLQWLHVMSTLKVFIAVLMSFVHVLTSSQDAEGRLLKLQCGTSCLHNGNSCLLSVIVNVLCHIAFPVVINLSYVVHACACLSDLLVSLCLEWWLLPPAAF